MKRYFIVFLIIVVTTLIACNQKNKEPASDNKFISVVSLIERQVAHVDTSLYAIRMIVQTDTLPGDTSYIPREQFRSMAKDFLNIPDLSDPAIAKRYKEEKAQYDETINRVIITYTPIDPEKEEIKKQELLVTPGTATSDKVSNIIINREIFNRDSLLKKDLLWMMDKSFQVVTTTQKPGKPEIITITKVSWNEDKDE